MQCAKLYDWKFVAYFERKKDQLKDPTGDLALWKTFIVQSSTIPLLLFNMQNRKGNVLTIN